LFDSNRDEQNILFKNEFDKWSAENKNLRIIYTLTEEPYSNVGNWKGERGMIDKAMLKRHLDDTALDNSIFYICGPPTMLKAMQDLLLSDLQISEVGIKVEEFT
jgi:glycine betaine catabolism B